MSTKLFGTKPNQIPLNKHLGSMAYQDMRGVNVNKINARTITLNGKNLDASVLPFKPYGDISSTTIQTALQELDDRIVQKVFTTSTTLTVDSSLATDESTLTFKTIIEAVDYLKYCTVINNKNIKITVSLSGGNHDISDTITIDLPHLNDRLIIESKVNNFQSFTIESGQIADIAGKRTITLIITGDVVPKVNDLIGINGSKVTRSTTTSIKDTFRATEYDSCIDGIWRIETVTPYPNVANKYTITITSGTERLELDYPVLNGDVLARESITFTNGTAYLNKCNINFTGTYTKTAANGTTSNTVVKYAFILRSSVVFKNLFINCNTLNTSVSDIPTAIFIDSNYFGKLKIAGALAIYGGDSGKLMRGIYTEGGQIVNYEEGSATLLIGRTNTALAMINGSSLSFDNINSSLIVNSCYDINNESSLNSRILISSNSCAILPRIVVNVNANEITLRVDDNSILKLSHDTKPSYFINNYGTIIGISGNSSLSVDTRLFVIGKISDTTGKSESGRGILLDNNSLLTVNNGLCITNCDVGLTVNASIATIGKHTYFTNNNRHIYTDVVSSVKLLEGFGIRHILGLTNPLFEPNNTDNASNVQGGLVFQTEVAQEHLNENKINNYTPVSTNTTLVEGGYYKLASNAALNITLPTPTAVNKTIFVFPNGYGGANLIPPTNSVITSTGAPLLKFYTSSNSVTSNVTTASVPLVYNDYFRYGIVFKFIATSGTYTPSGGSATPYLYWNVEILKISAIVGEHILSGVKRVENLTSMNNGTVIPYCNYTYSTLSAPLNLYLPSSDLMNVRLSTNTLRTYIRILKTDSTYPIKILPGIERSTNTVYGILNKNNADGSFEIPAATKADIRIEMCHTNAWIVHMNVIS